MRLGSEVNLNKQNTAKVQLDTSTTFNKLPQFNLGGSYQFMFYAYLVTVPPQVHVHVERNLSSDLSFANCSDRFENGQYLQKYLVIWEPVAENAHF